MFKAEPGCGCGDSLAFPSRGWGRQSPSFPAPSVQPRADSGDWSPVRSIGSVSGRGSGGLCPWSRGCGPWASLLPLHSTYQEESRVWYSLPHCPSAASPGTRFLSEKPPSQAPSRSCWSSALTLLHLSFVLELSDQGDITIAPSQTGVSPPSLVRLPPLSGQWAGQGWVRPGQTSRAERISLFLFSFSFLLPFPSAAVGISSLSPSQDACGPDVVA